MTRPSRLALVVALAQLGIAACDGDGGVSLAPTVPLAHTRFLHAVPDTGATDWRFIDALENSPPAFGLNFRGFTPYQATGPGMRRMRVFPTSTDISIAPKFLIDTTLSLDAGAYYTIVLFGRAGSGAHPAHHILLVRDDIQAPPAGQFGLRFVHLGQGVGSVDVYASSEGGAIPLPSAPMHGSVQLGAIRPYSALPVGTLSLRVTPESQTSTVLADAAAPRGEAANPAQNLTAIGGSLISGSVVSAFLLPRSVAGSSAPQATAFTVPTILFLVDRHPR